MEAMKLGEERWEDDGGEGGSMGREKEEKGGELE